MVSKSLEIPAFLDQGNTFRTVVSEDVAQELGIRAEQLVPLPANIVVRSADHNHRLALLGEFPHAVDLHIAGEKYWVRPVVVRGLRSGMNVSHLFLKKAGWTVDFKNSEVVTKGKQRYQLISHKQYRQKYKKRAAGPSINAIKVELGTSETPIEEEEGVYLDEDVCVPPLSAVVVKVRRGHPKKGQSHDVILGSAKFMENNQGCHTAAAAYTQWDEDGTAHTAILNAGGEKVLLSKDQKIGFFEEGEEIGDDEARQHIQQLAVESFQLAEAAGPGMCSEDPEAWYMGGPKSDKLQDKKEYIEKVFKLKENKILQKNKTHYKHALDLLVGYYDVFAFDGNYGHTSLIQHRIDVKEGVKPIKDKLVNLRMLVDRYMSN